MTDASAICSRSQFQNMQLTQTLTFEPMYMERVWGGRRLESLYGKRLPAGARIGESWEIVDREEAQSVVHEGELRGLTLNDLWNGHREAVFGSRFSNAGSRFPLLFKLLDAQDRLSVQVHPPPEVAEELDGEPKTEMWYIAEAETGADLFVGLNSGVTRESFREALEEGRVSDAVHRIPVKSGDSIFIPSGRIHAIGSGNVIVEVQQSSDTTYRVFDWNRLGLNGKPRMLHVEESMKSINFSDIEPGLGGFEGNVIGECEFFRVEKIELEGLQEACQEGDFAIFTVLAGHVRSGGCEYKSGDFFLMPATLNKRALEPVGGPAMLLRTMIP
jgi:mannose-6-phosphate isomerase